MYSLKLSVKRSFKSIKFTKKGNVQNGPARFFPFWPDKLINKMGWVTIKVQLKPNFAS